MSRTSDLYDLQKVDLDLAGQRAALADVDQRLDGNPSLDEMRDRLRREQDQLAALQAEQRERELRVREARARVEAAEQKLYGGGVTDARELGYLQASLEQDRAALERDEEELLDIMAQVEPIQAAVRSDAEELAGLESAWEEERASLQAQRADLAATLVALDARRAAVAVRVKRDDLQTYTVLSARLGGRPVARVERGICQECRIALPTVVIQRARRGEELATCSSCNRILYVS